MSCSFLLISLILSFRASAWYTAPKSPQDAYFHFYTSTFGDQETSVQVYETARWDQLNWNCVAAMSGNYLDAFSNTDPLLRAPPAYRTARHRVSCQFYALYETLPGFMPDMVETHKMQMMEWGYEKYTSESLRSGVRSCLDGDDKPTCLQGMLDLVLNDDTLEESELNLSVAALLGSMVGHLHSDEMKMDGFNANGMTGRNGETCSKNCWKYRDTTGYRPVNTPLDLVDETRWQPLIESDGIGFFYAQEHVTPQAGNLKAQSVPDEFLTRTVPDPNYDYEELDMAPVNAVAELEGDDMKKMLIEYLDAKSQILVNIGMAIDLWMGFSYEQKSLWLTGYTTVEIDAVAVTWKEKVRHDAIRPTSRVQSAESFVGNETMKWYDGSTVKKADWTPYIRVMPHAEYPSGSASICWSVQEYVDAWVVDNYGTSSIPITKDFAAGSSSMDSSVPSEDLSYTFEDMSEVARICSESRLWGGMHYPPSIVASKELVKDFGNEAYKWTQRLKNGEELPGILPEDRAPTPSPTHRGLGLTKCSEVKSNFRLKSKKGLADAIVECNAMDGCHSAVRNGKFTCSLKNLKKHCSSFSSDESACEQDTKCLVTKKSDGSFKTCKANA